MQEDCGSGDVNDGIITETACEIPRELFSLENNLNEQEEAIEALQEALLMVMRRDEVIEEDEANVSGATELGDKLKRYRLRVNKHTNRLKFLLRNLEL